MKELSTFQVIGEKQEMIGVVLFPKLKPCRCPVHPRLKRITVTKNHFTLIELLVVIAIIGKKVAFDNVVMLVSIWLPTAPISPTAVNVNEPAVILSTPTPLLSVIAPDASSIITVPVPFATVFRSKPLDWKGRQDVCTRSALAGICPQRRHNFSIARFIGKNQHPRVRPYRPLRTLNAISTHWRSNEVPLDKLHHGTFRIDRF